MRPMLDCAELREVCDGRRRHGPLQAEAGRQADLVAPDGAAIRSYGSMELEGYRIVRMLELIPRTAALQVRLKTPKSVGEIPFALAEVKLP